jgi:hypothetical protein
MPLVFAVPAPVADATAGPGGATAGAGSTGAAGVRGRRSGGVGRIGSRFALFGRRNDSPSGGAFDVVRFPGSVNSSLGRAGGGGGGATRG